MYVTFCWYCHVSWATSEEVFEDLSSQSLRNILLAHAVSSTPVSLAITGSVLSRLARVDPDTFDLLDQLIQKDLVELVGTFFHEIFVPTTDVGHIEAHVLGDLELKEQLFGKSPTSFFPANFNWSPALQIMLEEHGIQDVVLDELHLRLVFADVDFRWKPARAKPDASSIPSLVDKQDVLATFSTGQEFGGLNFHFRSTDALLATTYGDSGGIHKTMSEEPFEEFGKLFAGLDGSCLVADDFDRVNTASQSNYVRLLEKIGKSNVTPLRERSRNTMNYFIDYLPGHTTANLYDFWLDDPGSVHWARALDELSRQQQPGSPCQDLMKLQDCFPMFYSKHLDCLKFWRLAKEIRSGIP